MNIIFDSTIVMSFNHAVRPKRKPQFSESSQHEVLLSLNACLIPRLLANGSSQLMHTLSHTANDTKSEQW